MKRTSTPLFPSLSLVDKCEKCDKNAECIRGQCKCRPGYIGNGYLCERGMSELLVSAVAHDLWLAFLFVRTYV